MEVVTIVFILTNSTSQMQMFNKYQLFSVLKIQILKELGDSFYVKMGFNSAIYRLHKITLVKNPRSF
jgi:hypothetical protein